MLALDHIGSTSVPGLAAKPVIDADLTVADSADEPAYVPDLEATGFALRIREPDWEEHRLLTPLEDPKSTSTSSRPARRAAAAPRLPRLAAHPPRRPLRPTPRSRPSSPPAGFDDGMDYNNHKAALVYDIYERIFAADPAHEHAPQPRPTGH